MLKSSLKLLNLARKDLPNSTKKNQHFGGGRPDLKDDKSSINGTL